MKNKKFLFIGIIIALILLVPTKIYYKDGGSVGYKSILYEVTNYASLDGKKGIDIQILGIEVYNNVQQTSGMIIIDSSKDTIKFKESVVIFNMNKDTWKKDNKKPVLNLKDEEGLELFGNLLNNATKIDGLLDMRIPSYIGEVTLSSNYGGSIGAKTETIIFDIDCVGGMYCKAEDTKTWYRFDSRDVGNFVKYLDKINKKL